MESTDRRERARAAIQRVASDRRFQTNLTILSDRWNTVAQLGDSGVIARSATLADLVRSNPAQTFQREVAVCRFLTERGAPVQTPIGNVVVEDEIPISFWQFIDGEMGEASERAMVESLAQIHKLGADISTEQPWFATIAADIPQGIDTLSSRSMLDNQHARLLLEHFNRHLDTVITANLPGGLIHGDAQRKNSIDVGETAIWIDFEDCCVGPYAWDLACLTMNPNYPVERVLDIYAEFSGSDRIPSEVMAHLWALRDLEAVVWMMLIQEERDSGFRQSAQELLADILRDATVG